MSTKMDMNAAQMDRAFWDQPEKLNMDQLADMFYSRLFNRLKDHTTATTNPSSGDPGFPTYAPILEAATRMLYDGNSTRRYHGAVPNQQVIKKIVPFFEDIKVKPQGAHLHAENLTLGLGVTNLYSVMIKKLKEDYAEKYPHKKPVVLITTPNYGIFAMQPQLWGAEVKTIPLCGDNNWALDPVKFKHAIDDVERKGDRKVIAFYNANPHNPTGRVYTKAEIAPICDIMRKKDVFAIDDIIYHGTEHGEKKICPIASIPGMFDHTVTLYSLAKSLCGADMRVGVACGRAEDMKYIQDFNFRNFVSVPMDRQQAIGAALSMERYDQRQRNEYLSHNAEEYRLRYNIMKAMIEGLDSVNANDEEKKAIREVVRRSSNLTGKDADELLKHGMPGVSIKSDPEAGYFAVLDFSGVKDSYFGTTKIDTITKLAAHMVDSAKILVLPGPMMMGGKEDLMSARVSFAPPPEAVVKNMSRIKRALEQLTPEPQPGKQLAMPLGAELSRH